MNPPQPETDIDKRLGQMLEDVYDAGFNQAQLLSVGMGANTISSDALYKAKTVVTDLILEIIGKDENPHYKDKYNFEFKDHIKLDRNRLRAEQRNKLKDLS